MCHSITKYWHSISLSSFLLIQSAMQESYSNMQVLSIMFRTPDLFMSERSVLTSRPTEQFSKGTGEGEKERRGKKGITYAVACHAAMATVSCHIKISDTFHIFVNFHSCQYVYHYTFDKSE